MNAGIVWADPKIVWAISQANSDDHAQELPSWLKPSQPDEVAFYSILFFVFSKLK